MQEHDFERYKSLDFSNAKPLRQNPKFKKFQDNLKQSKDSFERERFFDDDVLIWLEQHPNSRQYVNEMLRNAIAMQS